MPLQLRFSAVADVGDTRESDTGFSCNYRREGVDHPRMAEKEMNAKPEAYHLGR